MAKRKLVEISPKHFRKITAIRNFLKRRGAIAPSVPAMVSRALDQALPALEREYTESI